MYRNTRMVRLALALAVGGGCIGATSALSERLPAPVSLAEHDRQTNAERPLLERFSDTPDGVDPVVTGPVSAAFKKTREALDCDAAVWPAVPYACYPTPKYTER